MDIGSLIGGGLQLVGGIAGSIASSRAAKKADQMIVDQKAKNQAWYDREYNQNYLQRSDAQAVLENTRKFYDDRLVRSAATNTVMGGTDEAAAIEKAAANEVVAQTMSDMNAQASQHKDAIQQSYMNADMNLAQQQIANQQQKGQNIAQAASGASAGAAGVVGSVFDKKK